MMPTDPERRPDREPEDQQPLPPVERMNSLVEKFQEGELTPSEADELLGYIEQAVWHAQEIDRTELVKKLRILEKGVESAQDLQNQGLHV